MWLSGARVAVTDLAGDEQFRRHPLDGRPAAFQQRRDTAAGPADHHKPGSNRHYRRISSELSTSPHFVTVTICSVRHS